MLELSLTGWRLLSLLGLPALVCIPLSAQGVPWRAGAHCPRVETAPGFMQPTNGILAHFNKPLLAMAASLSKGRDEKPCLCRGFFM
jgi:hypothetical protein